MNKIEKLNKVLDFLWKFEGNGYNTEFEMPITFLQEVIHELENQEINLIKEESF